MEKSSDLDILIVVRCRHIGRIWLEGTIEYDFAHRTRQLVPNGRVQRARLNHMNLKGSAED
eukprot:835347-Amphidinium_carterae.2